MLCNYLEPDEFGDICHAGVEDECPDPFKCTAKYDACGKPLQSESSGLDEETYGFY